MNAKAMTLVGLMAALLCVVGPLSLPLPFSPVPISLTSLAVYLAVYVSGMKWGTVSCLIYLLIGMAGVPVFSSFTGGPGKLFGPTGGYLAGFLLMALIFGYFVERWTLDVALCFLGAVLGTIVCYLSGTCWLAVQSGMSFFEALTVGVLPFIPGDLCKIVIAVLIGPKIRRRLKAAGLSLG